VRSLLTRKDYPVDFYPIYVGDKKEQWMKYAADHLEVTASKTKSTHLWDAEINSDFQRKYAVLQTPRLFLVDSNDIIIGRGLDAEALEVLLDEALREKELVYGSEASTKLYDSLFESIGENLKAKDVTDVADYIASSTLHKADTVMFRQMTGDLMYYLTMQFKGPYKEGLHYLVNEYVLSKPDVWRTQDDSLKVVGMAQAMYDLVSRTQVGTKIPSIEVPVTIKTHKRVKSKTISLSKLKHKKNIIMFYLPSCSNCKEEMAAAEKIMSKEKSKVALVLINMDEVYNDRELSGKLLDSFDLSIIPNILITDKSGKIIDRYVSLL
jgi:thiol-disulfide isomerase/thioredoxin